MGVYILQSEIQGAISVRVWFLLTNPGGLGWLKILNENSTLELKFLKLQDILDRNRIIKPKFFIFANDLFKFLKPK